MKKLKREKERESKIWTDETSNESIEIFVKLAFIHSHWARLVIYLYYFALFYTQRRIIDTVRSK